MRKILPLESVENLIRQGGHGTYRLFYDGNFQAGSHINEDEKTLTPDQLIDNLHTNLDLLGAGTYMIVLKRSTKSQSSTEVKYWFNFNTEDDTPAQQLRGTLDHLSGASLSPEKLEDLIAKRVAQALEQEREKTAIKEMMKDLEFQLKQLQTVKRRPVAAKSKEAQFLSGLMDMGKMAAAAFIAERYPNSVPLVEKTLAAMSSMQEEDEEDEEEGTGFSRPNSEDND